MIMADAYNQDISAKDKEINGWIENIEERWKCHDKKCPRICLLDQR